jgi:hypothetical protein
MQSIRMFGLTAEDGMKNLRVQVGGFYVNEKEKLAREVTHEQGDGNVLWRSYDLPSGRSTGDSMMCSLGQIVQWADREATAEEVARMNRESAEAKDFARGMAFVDGLLKHLPDELLVGEVRRRGLKVE